MLGNHLRRLRSLASPQWRRRQPCPRRLPRRGRTLRLDDW
jgi:hypothetical protein